MAMLAMQRDTHQEFRTASGPPQFQFLTSWSQQEHESPQEMEQLLDAEMGQPITQHFCNKVLSGFSGQECMPRYPRR
jgi:hypothetical protein